MYLKKKSLSYQNYFNYFKIFDVNEASFLLCCFFIHILSYKYSIRLFLLGVLILDIYVVFYSLLDFWAQLIRLNVITHDFYLYYLYMLPNHDIPWQTSFTYARLLVSFCVKPNWFDLTLLRLKLFSGRKISSPG